MPQHTVTAFDDELKELTRFIARMGGIAESMIGEAIQALIHTNTLAARKVVEEDASLDDLQRDVEENAITTIAKRQPMAMDLRLIIAALRIAADLERIGDLAKNIAKRVEAIEGQVQPKKLVHGLEHMADLAQKQVTHVLNAYVTRDAEQARLVWEQDEEIDAMYTSLFRELLTYMMEDPRNITYCTHLLFCAKNVERIGDHATNIAETIIYQVTGEQIDQERPKGDDSSTTTVSPATH